MAERGGIDRLDEAVDEIMMDPHAPIPGLPPQVAALLRIAADLRELPRPEFKARLGAALFPGRTVSDAGRPLATEADIEARLKELAEAPKLVAHDVRAALADLPEMTMRFLAALDDRTIGVSRLSGVSHWERHPAGDELLHVIEGEADVVTLTDAGPVRSAVRRGSIYVCPQGLWHRLEPRSPLSLLFATPGAGTEHSDAEELPRTGRLVSNLQACDTAALLGALPELAITSRTTAEEADAAVRTLGSLGPCTVGLMRYSGLTPWERHPDGDELLHVLDGEAEVTVLADDGPARVTLPAGSVFVCPRGLWHRQLARPAVTMLFGTPAATSEVSWAEDPRHET